MANRQAAAVAAAATTGHRGDELGTATHRGSGAGAGPGTRSVRAEAGFAAAGTARIVVFDIWRATNIISAILVPDAGRSGRCSWEINIDT